METVLILGLLGIGIGAGMLIQKWRNDKKKK
jgi:hypothetical protein